MANTQNYGLCAPHLPVRGAAVNQTVERMEAGIRRAQAALADQGYSLYNLMLQSNYDGKHTSHGESLVFDGFLNGSGVESSSTPAMAWNESTKRLELDAVGVSSLRHQYGTYQTQSITQGEWAKALFHPPCAGYLTQVSLYLMGRVTIDIMKGDTILATATAQGSGLSQTTATLSAPVTMGGGYALRLTATQSGTMVGRDGNAGGFGYLLTFQPTTATSGSVVTTRRALGLSYQCARAWVRHSAGSVGLSLWDEGAGTWRAMPGAGARTTVNLGGAVCKESAFSLEGAPAANRGVKLRLSVNTSRGTSVLIYDYGVVVF